MRAYFIAGLVSLSIAACGGTAALAQQPLWFTPQVLDSSPAGATDAAATMWPDAPPSAPLSTAPLSSTPLSSTPLSSTPLSSASLSSQSAATASKLPTFSQRFGDLFSKPGTRLAIAMGNEQAAIVTAGGVGEPTSPLPLGVPWASRGQERFSFAEIDSSDAQSRSARGSRGAQVRPMTPQVAPHLRAQADSTISDVPMQTTVPWLDSTVAADTPVANWPCLDQAQMASPLLQPNRIESVEHEERQPLQARLTSFARPLGHSKQELSPVLLVPADKLEFETEVQPSRVAIVPQQSSGGQSSPASEPAVEAAEGLVDKALQVPQPSPASDPVVDAAGAPRAEPPTISRFTDKTNAIADTSDQPAERIQTPDEEDKSRRPIQESLPEQTPLLKTESMIGPLKGAEQLFHRLDLVEDLRTFGAPAAVGPREDVSQFEWMPTPYTWISPAFYHYPLYFEQPNLERYGIGRARAVQPLLSSAHFFWSIPLLPYKTLAHHPRERVYTLGQGRPGNCLPVQRGVILGPSKVGEVSMFWE